MLKVRLKSRNYDHLRKKHEQKQKQAQLEKEAAALIRKARDAAAVEEKSKYKDSKAQSASSASSRDRSAEKERGGGEEAEKEEADAPDPHLIPLPILTGSGDFNFDKVLNRGKPHVLDRHRKIQAAAMTAPPGMASAATGQRVRSRLGGSVALSLAATTMQGRRRTERCRQPVSHNKEGLAEAARLQMGFVRQARAAGQQAIRAARRLPPPFPTSSHLASPADTARNSLPAVDAAVVKRNSHYLAPLASLRSSTLDYSNREAAGVGGAFDNSTGSTYLTRDEAEAHKHMLGAAGGSEGEPDCLAGLYSPLATSRGVRLAILDVESAAESAQGRLGLDTKEETLLSNRNSHSAIASPRSVKQASSTSSSSSFSSSSSSSSSSNSTHASSPATSTEATPRRAPSSFTASERQQRIARKATLEARRMLKKAFASLGMEVKSIVQREGVRIVRKDVRGPAHMAGLMVDDVVTAIDGKSLRNISTFERSLDQCKPYTAVVLHIDRGERQLCVDVVPDTPSMSMQQYRDLVQIALGHLEPREVTLETQTALDGKPVAVSMPSDEVFAKKMEEEEGAPLPSPRTLAFQLKQTFDLKDGDPLLVGMSGQRLDFLDNEKQSALQRERTSSFVPGPELAARLERLKRLKAKAKKATRELRQADLNAMRQEVEELGQERLALERELQGIPAELGFQLADMRRNRAENAGDHGGGGGSLIMRKGKLVRGVRVGEVKKNMPAALVLKPRDIILSANDTLTPAPAALMRILHPDKPLLAGHPIVLNVLRQFRYVEFADSDEDEEYEGDGGQGASKRLVYDPHSDGGAVEARWRELRLSFEVGSSSRSIEDIRMIRRRIPEIRRVVHELQVRRSLLLAIKDNEAKESAYKASPEYKQMMEKRERKKMRQLRLEKVAKAEKARLAAQEAKEADQLEADANSRSRAESHSLPREPSGGNIANSPTKSQDVRKALLDVQPLLKRDEHAIQGVLNSDAGSKKVVNLQVDVNAASVPIPLAEDSSTTDV